MIKVTVNDKTVEVKEGSTVYQACSAAGIEIPVFCYHPRLSIAGNCRMCLVEVDRIPKPIASCSYPASEGMIIRTNSPMVENARKGVLELLLINHPLDCPICDQGGECDLQDITVSYGPSQSRFAMNKRAVSNKYMGPLVKTIMTRCIHCTRCVRFANEVAGIPEIGILHRGEKAEITTYLEKSLTSELSGNLIDICPVGALTNKTYSFKGRPWELKKTYSIDILDAVGSNIRIDSRGREIMRILPRTNDLINEDWISDKARFAFDGLTRQRLDRYYLRVQDKLTETTPEEAYAVIGKALCSVAPHEVAALSGNLADAESVTVLKDLMDAIGSPHYDCRIDGACHEASNRGSYLFNSTIAGIEEADYILLIAANVRHEAPIINARIRKRYLLQGLPGKDLSIGVIGPAYDLTYKYDHGGGHAPALKEILEGTNPLCEELKKAKKPLLIIGQGALCRRDSQHILQLCQDIAEKYGFIQPHWNGFNVLHTAAGRVGALDLGFVPSGNGLDAHGILQGCQSGKIKVLLLNGVDDIPIQAFGEAFVVYVGHHGDTSAHRANVILPGCAYTEKSATYVNTEGRVQHTQIAVAPPGQAIEDWCQWLQVGKTIGIFFPYYTLEEVRNRMKNMNPVFDPASPLQPASWQKVVVTTLETLSHVDFKSPVENFYMTDPISRNSQTMAQCCHEIPRTGGKC